MKKTASVLSKCAYGLGAAFLLYLTLNSMHYTFHFDLADYFSKNVYEGPDSRILSLLMLVLFAAAAFLLSRLLFLKCKSEDGKKKRVFIFSLVVSLLVFVLSVLWISYAGIAPWFDQETVYLTAQNFNAKDYFKEPTYWLYLKQYPQEFGLVFIEAMLLKIWNSYLFLEYLNAAFVALTVFFAGRLALEISQSPFASFTTVLATALTFPLYYYESYVYGDIFSIFGILFVSWNMIKWWKGGKKRYVCIALIMACIMVPARENNLIFLIALAISLIIQSLKSKKWLPVLVAVVMLVVPLFLSKCTRWYYENAADYQIDNEIPSINWVVMGLRGNVDEGKGVGFFDGYVYWDWNLLGQDKEATKAKAYEDLKDILEGLRSLPLPPLLPLQDLRAVV